MEWHPCGTRTAGLLSVAALRVMAALRAQYAGRIDRRPHIADSPGRAPRLSQNQGAFNKTRESHTQAKMSFVSSSYHRESVVNHPQPDLVEKHSYNTKPQLHKDRERQLFKHSPEMALPCQSGLRQLHDKDNGVNQWGTDKRGDWRPRDYRDVGSLSGLNSGNNIPGLSRAPPEPDPQGDGLFPRNGFINRGNPQAVMGLPEPCSEISSSKEGIQLLASNEEDCKAKAVIHTPPVKRWRFGLLQMPVITCSEQFEEDDCGQNSGLGKTNENPDKMPFWHFEEKTEITEEGEVNQKSRGEINKFEFDSVVLGGGVKESSYGKVCENGQNEMEDYSRSLAYQSYLNEMPISRRESQKISLVLVDSCHGSATNKMLSNGSHLPVHHTLVSLRTSDFDQYTEDKGKEPAEMEHGSLNSDLYMHQSNMKNDQTETQDHCIEPQHSAAPKDSETHHNQQAISQAGQMSSGVECAQNVTLPIKQPGKWKPPHVTLSQEPCSIQTSTISGDTRVKLIHQAQQSKGTKQFLNPLKSTPNQDKMPVQTTTPLREHKKRDSKMEIVSSIPKAAREHRSASEVKEQMYLETDRDGDKTSETTKRTPALISDPRVCDASRLSQEERMCVLEEAARARALVVTMVYQDGTTQLDPEQKCPSAVCGVLVLLKKSLDSLVLEETGAAEERLLFLRLEQKPVWVQQDPQYNQDLFTREILVKMVCGTQTLVCYKSKDLLRTALRHFSKDLSWKQVADCQVLDPQIAAWLLDPADSASCFQDLFNKYCTRPTPHTPAQAELRHQKVNHVICSLSQLHRVMVELRNKLESQGLWQLYFCMEQKMIPVLAAMESHRIHVDREALKKTSEMLGTKMKQLEQEAHQTAGQKFLVSSSSQLRMVLFEKLRLHERCENKKLPKTMLKQQQSTSEAVLLQLQDLHPLPKIVLEYRQVHKIKSTFLDGILSCMTKTFISSTWNQTSTVSGRLSAKHPNFQALPRQPVQISKKQCVEGKEAELVTVHPRTMFVPGEGWTFLSADFCQVELRLLAHLSSDPELLRIFQNPEADVFNMLASQWKGVNEDSVRAEDREHAKRIVYSVVYGAGKERLSGILGVSAEEAIRFQDRFLQKYKEVQAFIQRTVQYCHKYGYVKSIMGRRRSLPHIHSTDWGIRNQAERQAVNFVVQGSAADLCKMAMIHICSLVASSTTLTARLVAQIHDELLFEVEDSQVEDFAVLVKKTMESLQHISCLGVSLTVPLKVSVSTGRSWGSMCEVSFPHAATARTSV